MSQANQFTSDDIAALAVERTGGLDDFGPDTWRDGLDVLLDVLNGDERVTADGYANITGGYVAGLWNRLRVFDYAKQHPEVRERIESPLVIVGMPRTGTTVISYLLDQDPARRSLLHWECVRPDPAGHHRDAAHRSALPGAAGASSARCLAFVKQAKMPLPHWEDADGPTEDMFVHDQDFKALSWDSFLPTAAYARVAHRRGRHDVAPTSTRSVVLQILQSKAPGTWSLKMPSHSVHIETLLKVFPDVRMVWAHRDPYKATGSLCNLWRLPQGMVMQAEVIDREAMVAPR